jgi:plasmid stabilization system protein ParE
MRYHIDTGLIYEKFKEDCNCPLCEIQKIVEEQFLYEFLNDAVMEDNTRIKVGKKGFCEKHFDMLFSRQNKLSVALQIGTRVDKLLPTIGETNSVKSALKQAQTLENESTTCVICDLVEESMVKYYKTIAQMFAREMDFVKTLISSKDDKGEYRRIVSGNFSIIYQIKEDEITILRIFNQKENYLNQENFILREKSNKYLVIQSKRSIF